MKRSVYRAGLLLAGSLLVITAAPAQDDSPESLLPDIFGPADEPPPPPRTPQPAIPIDPGAPASPPLEPEQEEPEPEPEPEVEEAPDPLAGQRATADMRLAGPLTPARGGYGMSTFAGSNGALFAAWMRRIDTPIASRWAHIVLRRALLSRAPTPPEIRDADWIAARALLLLKMGEADGAKLLLSGLPLDRYTPQLYSVASQVHLAAADVPALCPLAPTARAISDDPFWRLATAICAGIQGDDVTAVNEFNRLRREEAIDPVDLLLAERITGLAGGVDRAANVDWEGVTSLDAFAFGAATAGGVEVPEEVWENAPPAVHGWAFRTAETPIEQRVRSARIAARAGIVSARELGAVASILAERTAAAEELPDQVRLLRAAYTGRTAEERVSAMEELWEDGAVAGERYSALIMTAPAAAQIEPDPALLEAAPRLVASMLAGGRMEAALSWWPLLAGGEDEALRMRVWPMLVLADDGNRIPLSPGLVRAAYKSLAADNEAEARRRVRWLIAGLAGLDKIGGSRWNSLFEDFGVGRRGNVYTEALSLAAQRGRKGEVAVLAALGLQGRWSQVRPADLRPILSAYDAVGLDAEARLMAVEALTRAP